MADRATKATASASLRVTTRPPRRTNFTRGLNGYLFLLPTFIFIGYFLYYPAWTALYGAFTRWDGFNPPQFIGLENFRRAFADRVLWTATKNNVIWAVFGVILSIVPPFLTAELIFHLKRVRLQYLYRTLFTITLIVPTIVTILLWRYFYSRDGLLNQLLTLVGLPQWQQAWISNPRIALYSLVLMGFPWIAPFNLLIFYAGLQGISTEVLESAGLDGAAGLRRIWSMDIPLIRPQLKLLFILSVIGSVQHLIVPLLMTGGGPGYATYVPLLHMYNVGIRYGEFGYSMAISFLIFVVILILTGINARFIRGNTEDAT